jgi:hypothetical protein
MSSSEAAVTPLAHSIEETRVLLGGLSRPTINKLCRNRELVSRKVGARRLILRSSIESFLRKDHPTMTAEMREIRRKAREGKKRKSSAA